MNNEKLSLFKKFNLASRCRVIKLVDIFLIIILLLLIFQSIYNLFTNEVSDNDAILRLDLIFRSSLSSIYGYILSANFLNNGQNKSETNYTIKPSEIVDTITEQDIDTNKIGFTSGILENPENSPPTTTSCNCHCEFDSQDIQIFIIGTLGVFALIVLIVARNLSTEIPLSEIGLSQIRDMLSASTGFLLGYPSKK